MAESGVWDRGLWAMGWAMLALIAVLFPLRSDAAQTKPNLPQVDLALVLAVDASGSVSNDRFELQTQGYAAAFRNPKIFEAIHAGNLQSIAVMMVQWTGPDLHVPVVRWTVLKDQRSVLAFADTLSHVSRELFGGGTSLSGAIEYGTAALIAAPVDAGKQVIDISGDGSNDSIPLIIQARDHAVKLKIGINGLPILTVEPDLDKFYKQYVTGGPGSFVIAAKDYNAFANAILRKLVAEISQNESAGRSFASNSSTISRRRRDCAARRSPAPRPLPHRPAPAIWAASDGPPHPSACP